MLLKYLENSNCKPYCPVSYSSVLSTYLFRWTACSSDVVFSVVLAGCDLSCHTRRACFDLVPEIEDWFSADNYSRKIHPYTLKIAPIWVEIGLRGWCELWHHVVQFPACRGLLERSFSLKHRRIESSSRYESRSLIVISQPKRTTLILFTYFNWFYKAVLTKIYKVSQKCLSICILASRPQLKWMQKC